MNLIGIDTETTSPKPATAEILQIGMVQSDVCGNAQVIFNMKCRPTSGVVPDEASQVHGIYMDELKYQPLDIYAAYSAGLMLEDIDEMVMVTYNGESYDLPILQRYGANTDYPHIDVFRLVQRELFPHGLKLGEVLEGYVGEKLEGAHDAIPDVFATIRILTTYLYRTGKTVHQVVGELAKPIELETCYFGKHQGVPFRKVPKGYLRWVRDNWSDMSADLEHTLELILGE